jgi:cell division protease FtsH
MGGQRDYSDEVAARVDEEVRSLIDNAHEEARQILRQHRKVLDRLADALCERETLDTPELMEIFGDLPTWESVTANSVPAARRRRTTKSSS